MRRAIATVLAVRRFAPPRQCAARRHSARDAVDEFDDRGTLEAFERVDRVDIAEYLGALRDTGGVLRAWIDAERLAALGFAREVIRTRAVAGAGQHVIGSLWLAMLRAAGEQRQHRAQNVTAPPRVSHD